MPNFKNGQDVWYLRPGMATPIEMTYLGIEFDKPGFHALLAKSGADVPSVLGTQLKYVYSRSDEAKSIAKLWVRDRLEQIEVDIRTLEEERKTLTKEMMNG